MTLEAARLSLLLFGLAIAGVAADPAGADEGVTFSNETLADWGVTTQSGVMGGYPATLSEFVPPGETMDDWTQMVTVASYDLRGVKARPTAETVYAGMSEQYRVRCGEYLASEPERRQVQVDPATFFIVACDAAPDGPTAGSGDYTAVLLIETDDALHMVQRAWRGLLPDPSVRPISDAELADWTSFFDSVRVAR